MEKVKLFLKRHRRAALNTLTVLAVVLLLGLNILFPYLQEKNADYIDLTPEGLYTLSDKMVSTCEGLQGEITITFCAKPDMLLSAYETRYVYIMAMQLSNRFDNIHVETYDIQQNPTAVNRFKTTSASVIPANAVIISCGNRYRILTAPSFWALGETSESNTDYYSFNGEYKMATALLAITAVVQPVVCFAYGHGENIYVDPEDTQHQELLSLSDADRSAFYYLMVDAGLRVEYVDLDKEEIPQECVLLVLDGTTVDYSVGDPNSLSERTPIRRIHEFLASERALMVFKDPTAILPNLEDLCEDWGVGFGYGENAEGEKNPQYIRDDAAHSLTDTTGRGQKIIATLISEEDSAANAIYEDIVKMGIAARTVVEDSGWVYKSWINDYVAGSTTQNVIGYYYDFFITSGGAAAYTVDGMYDEVKGPHSYTLAALTMRMRTDSYSGETFFACMFAAATTALTSNTYLDNRAYCNYDILYATVRNISRVDVYASLELGGVSLNSPIPGGKPLFDTDILAEGSVKYDEKGQIVSYYTLLTEKARVRWTLVLSILPAVVFAVAGTTVIIKRKNR